MGNKPSQPNPLARAVHKSRDDLLNEQAYSKAKIEEALAIVAKQLHAKRRDYAIVAVGGAVNTVLLNSRASTGDVDFFYRSKNSRGDAGPVLKDIRDATGVASKKLKLNDHWLNDHTAMWIDESILGELYAEAILQDEKVFSAKGLTVYAAPWKYALMTKLERAGKRGAKAYDMRDAVDYLRRFITGSNGRRPIKRSEIQALARKYRLSEPTDEVIDRLAAEYKAKYKQDGVV